MDNLNELEKITIEFPVTITEDEIEEKFFSHLRDKVPCDITYGRDPREFELSEYACSRNEQLFIDKIRQKTQGYFSKRPK